MYSWRTFSIKRLLGLDLKTNTLSVVDGRSLDAENVYQKQSGVAGKRSGYEIMFDGDETSSVPIDEIGKCRLLGQDYWFKFSDGKFKYATSRAGALTTISPSPAISTSNSIFWAVLDDKLFFVDGTNVLRYFNGTSVLTSSIYTRPTVALTTASVGTGFDYTYTVDNGLGESPACSTLLTNKVSAASVVITGNTGPQTLVAGDVVRVYSKATSIAAASKLVATYTWTGADVIAGTKTLATSAISDTQTQLYSELGLALNKSAPTGLQGITVHYGRLVGWLDDTVYNSKSSNPHAWPDDAAQKQAFVYSIWAGDGLSITRCISFKEDLYVMKPGNIAVFGGVGPDDTGNNAYSFRRLETLGDGCAGGKSVAIVGDEDSTFLVWLSRNGYRATEGARTFNIGEDIETQIQGLSEAIIGDSVAYYDKGNQLYVCTLGGITKTTWVYDVRKDKEERSGWWKWTGLNASCVFYEDDRALVGLSSGVCMSARVTGASSDFADVKQEYFATAAVDTSAETIAVTLDYTTGDEVKVRSTGTVPAGLTANTIYYAIRVSSTSIKLATSLSDAQAGTAINLTSQGSGTHSLTGTKAIAAYYTTNWLNFGSASKTKKLGKPCFIFNTLAQTINVRVECAFDWLNQFFYAKTISLSSTEEWGGDTWGSFIWGSGGDATPKNTGLPRRKVRSIRYKFSNSTINQDLNLLGLEQDVAILRNRGNFAA